MIYHRDCQLRLASTSSSYLPEILPGSTMNSKIKRYLKSLSIASYQHPETFDYFKSQTTLIAEHKRHIQNFPWYIVHPFSRLVSGWDKFLFVALGINLINIPFAVAFSSFFSPGRFLVFVLIDALATVIGVAEIVLNFITGYVDRQRNVILEPRAIARRYLRGIFVLDVWVALPHVFYLYLTFHDWRSKEYNGWRFPLYIYLMCLFRLVKLNKCYFNFMKGFSTTKEYTHLGKILMMSLYVLHFSACFRFILVLMNLDEDISPGKGNDYFSMDTQTFIDSLNPNSTVELLRDFILRMHVKHSVFAQRVEPAEKNMTLLHSYIKSLMYTTKIATACAFTIEGMDKFYNILYSYLILVFGFLWFNYVTLTWMKLLAGTEMSLTQYEYYYDQMLNYCRLKRLPRRIERRVLRYYKQKYRGRYFNESRINGSLSSHLKKEILMKSCHALITSVTLFRDLPDQLIENIVQLLKPELFMPNDVIVKAGEEGTSMYLIEYGTAIVVSADGVEIKCLRDGDYFGEIVILFKNRKRIATVIAQDICHVYRLSKEDFQSEIASHEQLLSRLQQQAIFRINQTHKMTQSTVSFRNQSKA